MKRIVFKCKKSGLVNKVLIDGKVAHGIVTASLRIVARERPELILELYGSDVETVFQNVTVRCVNASEKCPARLFPRPTWAVKKVKKAKR